LDNIVKPNELFAATMFKEEDDETKEFDEKAHKYGYITIVSLESVENATLMAALTFIDISGALLGAFISISTYVALAGVLHVLIMPLEPRPSFITPLRSPIEPLIHPPQRIKAARICGIGVIDDAI
jgi:hypothetical protein